MPDRPEPTPESGADPLSDLFSALPDPAKRTPDSPEQTPPAPGSRRAAREAARQRSTQDAAASEDVTGAQGDVPAGAPRADVHDPRTTDAAAAIPAAESAPAPAPAHESAPARNAQQHASLDDLFDTAHEPKQPRARRTRKRGCLTALIIVLVLVAGAAAGGVWVWNTYGDKISDALGWGPAKDYAAGEATGEALVTVYENDTGAEVSKSLYDAGVTKTEDVFYDMLIDEGINPTFYPGVYQLQQKMTAAAALDALENPDNKMEHSALIREGLTVEQTIAELSESLAMPLEDFEAAVADPSAYGVAAQNLEGWLFPALYEFEQTATAADIIGTLVDRTRQSLAAAGVPAADEERILTIASIIQREARAEEDFYKVSRVIANRLAIDMKLEMDSTAQYGYGELHKGSASTSGDAQHDDNPWNTYVYTGLPVTPIASSGDVAIDAAMHPVDGPWLFFVTVNMDTGETIFTESYEQHEVYVEQMQQWCAENPDSGC